MRILIDIRSLNPEVNSGIGEYVQAITLNLLTLDRKNEYLLFYNSGRKKALPETLLPYADRVVNWRIPNRILNLSMGLINQPKLGLKTSADVIFSPHFNFVASGKTPRIITLHDISFAHYPDFFSWRQKIWHRFQRWEKQAREAKHIIAVSEYTREDLIQYLKIPAEKITTIYSGVNPSLQKSEDAFNSIRPKPKLINYPYILYLGTLEPRKNIPAIIRAFNLLKKKPEYKKHRLVLAGKKGWLYQDILTEAKRSPHLQDIIFWGEVAESDKKILYTGAEVFVYPSFFEGFGFPPLEAQACGTPVVVSDRASLPEILKSSASYANPWDPMTVASAINQINIDKTLRTRLIAAGFKNSSRFRWQITAKKTLEIIERYAPHHQ